MPPYLRFLDFTAGLFAPTWQEKKQRVACEVWVARPEDSVAPFCSCYWPDPSVRPPHNCRGSWKIWPSCALEEMEKEFDIHILLATYCLSDSS